MTAREPWSEALRAAGERHLAPLAALVDAADPERSVEPRSRALCAGLSALALECYRALGGRAEGERVGEAAAALSLLTKLDDQVIDGPAFHGGWAAPRSEVRARTRAFLAPTLASLRDGVPARDEPRCALAARFGALVRALSTDPARRERLLAVIADGWEVQVDSVATFTAHPGEVSLEEVSTVTARVSGAWLTMVTLVGTLPEDASRTLTEDEASAILGWGGWIQRADALADLARDLSDGLVSTVPSRLAWGARGGAWLDAVNRRDFSSIYGMIQETGGDVACLPPGGALDALALPLGALGGVSSLFGWIQGFLLGRYLAHPWTRREPLEPAFAGRVVECPRWLRPR